MRLVGQLNVLDCGIAVAAMLAGVSRTEAGEYDPNPKATRGLSVPEMVQVLEGLTQKAWKIRKIPAHTTLFGLLAAGQLPATRKPEAFLLRKPGQAYGHWIAVSDRHIFDSQATVSFRHGPQADPVYRMGRTWHVLRRIVQA